MIFWIVTELKVLSGHRLEVGFADGLRGVVDMSKDDFSGVFSPLADESYFAFDYPRRGGGLAERCRYRPRCHVR